MVKNFADKGHWLKVQTEAKKESDTVNIHVQSTLAHIPCVPRTINLIKNLTWIDLEARQGPWIDLEVRQGQVLNLDNNNTRMDHTVWHICQWTTRRQRETTLYIIIKDKRINTYKASLRKVMIFLLLIKSLSQLFFMGGDYMYLTLLSFYSTPFICSNCKKVKVWSYQNFVNS